MLHAQVAQLSDVELHRLGEMSFNEQRLGAVSMAWAKICFFGIKTRRGRGFRVFSLSLGFFVFFQKIEGL